MAKTEIQIKPVAIFFKFQIILEPYQSNERVLKLDEQLYILTQNQQEIVENEQKTINNHLHNWNDPSNSIIC